MIKKVIVLAITVCTIVAAFSISSSASLYYGNQGIDDVYNGSYWSRQAWVEAHSTSGSYTVRVGIEKNNVRYGIKPTIVSSGSYLTCKSNYVQITGGKVYKDPANPQP